MYHKNLKVKNVCNLLANLHLVIVLLILGFDGPATAAEPSRAMRKLLIVAHPDDEAIFFGAEILSGGYYVFCLTEGGDPARRADFERTLRSFIWRATFSPCPRGIMIRNYILTGTNNRWWRSASA